MFYVLFDDNTEFVETKDVGWADVPQGKKIISVGLTDGHMLVNSLQGFDFYIVVYEAVSRRTVEVRAAGGPSPKVVSAVPTAPDQFTQILYGIRDLTRHRRAIMAIKKEVHQLLVRTFKDESKVGQNYVAVQAKKLRLDQLDADVADLQARLSTVEVCEMRLGFTVQNLTRDRLREDPRGWREGLAYDVDPSFIGEARKRIRHEDEKVADL
jgi:hypothetical protein